jgi:hypothetical protein
VSRFRRSLLGYRRSDVDEALAARDSSLAESGRSLATALAELEAARARIAELEHVADRLSDRVVAREGELEMLRSELAKLRAESERPLRALATLAEELETVRGQARGQATRIRMLALREAAELSERIAELTRGPAETRERLLDAIGEALGAIGGARSGADIAIDPGRAGAVSGESAGPEARREPTEGPKLNGEAPPRIAEDVFVGSVEVEVGPLSDFSQLVGFEDAAGGIGAASEISVTRFARGRATLAMSLAEPVELLRELEERAPFEFRVRDLRADRVILDLDDE